MRIFLKTITAAAAGILSVPAALGGYDSGILIVNEDWYGHQNSTINHLDPEATGGEYWTYRVFQKENPGMELGCTACYGAVFDGRLYIISKQAKDPGASVTGGRITVADASDMKAIRQIEDIDPSGAMCDGRAFLGISPEKAYVSTSNGIWVMDLSTFGLHGPIEGTGNPTGSLYRAQTGMMVEACGKVFAAHQQKGLLVINPQTDTLEAAISMECAGEGAGIGSVVKAADGSLWASVAAGTAGTGAVIDRLVRIDPETLRTEAVDLPDDVNGPANSWYAWTADAFRASPCGNVLYWKGGDTSWFAGQHVFRFDVASRKAEKIIDLEADGEGWNLYGCSLGISPADGDLYVSLYHEFGQPDYVTRRYDSAGTPKRDFPMIENYWFPGMFLFLSGQSGIAAPSAEEAAVSLAYSGGCLLVTTAGESTVSVCDLQGRTVAVYHTDNGTNTIQLRLPRGIYVARCGEHFLKFSL